MLKKELFYGGIRGACAAGTCSNHKCSKSTVIPTTSHGGNYADRVNGKSWKQRNQRCTSSGSRLSHKPHMRRLRQTHQICPSQRVLLDTWASAIKKPHADLGSPHTSFTGSRPPIQHATCAVAMHSRANLRCGLSAKPSNLVDCSL